MSLSPARQLGQPSGRRTVETTRSPAWNPRAPSPTCSTRLSWLAAVGGLLVLLVIGALAVIGSLEPAAYYALTYPFGVAVGSGKILIPPFPPLTTVQLFDITDNPLGTHLYLLGSDAGGRDLLALTSLTGQA